MELKRLIEVFRITAAEFKEIPDDTVVQWLELTAPMASRKRFGKVYPQAVALLAAHRMKLAGFSSDTLGGQAGKAVNGFGIASYSEGSTSISYNTANMNAGDDSWYALTSYGMEYLNLRRLCSISIVSSGEAT